MNKIEDTLAKLVAYIIVMFIMAIYMPYYWLFEHKYWKKGRNFDFYTNILGKRSKKMKKDLK